MQQRGSSLFSLFFFFGIDGRLWVADGGVVCSGGGDCGS